MGAFERPLELQVAPKKSLRGTQSVQKNSQVIPKRLPRSLQGTPRRIRRSPRDTQGIPKGPKGSPRVPKESPRVPQGSPRSEPGIPQGSPRDPQGLPKESPRVSDREDQKAYPTQKHYSIRGRWKTLENCRQYSTFHGFYGFTMTPAYTPTHD